MGVLMITTGKMTKILNTLFLAVLLFICGAGRLFGAETYFCAAGDELGLMFHFGSGGLSDVAVFEGKDEYVTYAANDFSTFEVKEPSGKQPDDYRIKLVRNKPSKDLPAITIDIRENAGNVIFRGKRYRVKCDWDD